METTSALQGMALAVTLQTPQRQEPMAGAGAVIMRHQLLATVVLTEPARRAVTELSGMPHTGQAVVVLAKTAQALPAH